MSYMKFMFSLCDTSIVYNRSNVHNGQMEMKQGIGIILISDDPSAVFFLDQLPPVLDLLISCGNLSLKVL